MKTNLGEELDHRSHDEEEDLEERQQLMQRNSELDELLQKTEVFTKSRVSGKEKLEIGVYRFLYLLPVFVTFGLILYIAVFYMSIYVVPSILGYYEWLLRVHNPWS